MEGKEELHTRIKHYFNNGYTHLEILTALSVSHGFVISLRQLQRVLSSLNLKRRVSESSLFHVVSLIQEELKGSGRCLEYRSMWLKLKK